MTEEGGCEDGAGRRRGEVAFEGGGLFEGAVEEGVLVLISEVLGAMGEDIPL